MTMGQTGMGGMGEHAVHMGVPENSIPMIGAPGPYAYIDMGGMFTILKVREQVNGYGDPGWYEAPWGTVSDVATEDELRRDGIDVNAIPAAPRVPTPPAQKHLDDPGMRDTQHGGGHGTHGPATKPAVTTPASTRAAAKSLGSLAVDRTPLQRNRR
jgi:hypothetical protein